MLYLFSCQSPSSALFHGMATVSAVFCRSVLMDVTDAAHS